MLGVADCIADCVWLAVTKGDRMAARRKSDRSRACHGVGVLRKGGCSFRVDDFHRHGRSPLLFNETCYRCEDEGNQNPSQQYVHAHIIS